MRPFRADEYDRHPELESVKLSECSTYWGAAAVVIDQAALSHA
jgi:hypothetical protein